MHPLQNCRSPQVEGQLTQQLTEHWGGRGLAANDGQLVQQHGVVGHNDVGEGGGLNHKNGGGIPPQERTGSKGNTVTTQDEAT